MTTFRCPRPVKSGIAAVVSAALVLTSAGPGTRAFAQTLGAGAAAESGAVRAVSIGAGAAPSASVSLVSLSAVSLSPALSAPSALGSAPSVAAAPASAAAVAAASARPSAGAAPALPAAAAPALASPSSVVGRPAAAAAASEEGPRWVGTPVPPAVVPAPEEAPARSAEAGPRWVAPAKGGVTAWLGRQLSRWTGAAASDDGRRAFDGDSERANSAPAVDASAGRASDARALGAHSHEDARGIIDDMSIPTPEAARRVGELRHEHGAPLWAKVVAPLAVVAAGAAAIHFGAVGVLTLGAGLVLSVLAHEVSHLAVLKALGDRTAVHAGEHSLNPFHHVDPVKTVILPALSLAISSAFLPFPILIGAGKPVDADFNNLRGPLGGPRSARNAFWVAAAGPLTNFALAGLAFGAAAFLPAGGLLAGVAIGLAHMNVALGVFNLLPLPQLDGGKILASVLPESWYAKWVYNPNVERGYQGLFRRLYEGPSNLLALVAEKLGVKDQTTLNRVANGATFGALAAFYAIAYFHFSVALPLLFLALPCTYDYWCIREKVRSEAAVKDVMDIFSQWSAVIAQIAEDHGMQSEVSLFETEHAMKNAIETLVDEMMAKEGFRSLPTDQKIAKLMEAYPERAADFLKEKVFTDPADSREKILEMLADQRNTPFYERLRRWFSDHEIFDRWDNPKYEGKLKDQMKQADKPKAVGQRGSTTLGMLGFLALAGGASMLFPQLAPHAPTLAVAGLGLLGLAGTLGVSGGAPTWQSKLRPRPGDVSFAVKIRFTAGTSLDAARQVARGFGDSDLLASEPAIELRVNPDNLSDASDIARSLADNVLVESLSVPTSVFDRLRGTGAAEDAAVDQADGFAGEEEAPASAQAALPFDGAPATDGPRARAWHAKLRVTRGAQHTRLTVVFRAGTSVAVARRAVESYANTTAFGQPSRIVYRIDTDSFAGTVAAARELAKLGAVETVSVTGPVRHRLTGRNAEPSDAAASAPAAEEDEEARAEPPAEAIAPAEEAQPAPVETAEQAAARREAEIEAEASATEPSGWAAKIAVAREGEPDVPNNELRVQLVDGVSAEVREKLVATIDHFDAVTRATVHDDGSIVIGTRFSTDDAAAALKEISLFKIVRSATASLDVRDRVLSQSLPAKISSHGKDHWSTSAALVRFGADVPVERVKALLGRHGQKSLFRQGDAYVLEAATEKKIAEDAASLALESDVAAVEVHPNVAAALENRLKMPYPDAQSYNPEQAVLVAFKPGTSVDDMKAFAEARHLRVVHPRFRGSESLSLLEILRGGDAAATRQILIDETLDEGAIIAEVKPFREQAGDAPLAPSAAASARAAARKAAVAAAEEAQRHKPRRDVQGEWMSFLQNHKLQDGTTLNPKMVEGLAALLKPVAKQPDDRRAPVVGRNEEVKRALPILTSPRGMRNSVMVIGEAGTGKTAVAEGLSEMIEDAEYASANDPETFRQFQRLKGRWLVSLDIPALLASEDPVGMLTQILKILPLFNEKDRSRGNEVILLMDEVQALFGDPQLGTKLGNVIKGPLRDGNVSVIATTTSKEYKKYIENDDALRRRFEKIEIAEMTVPQTTRVLRAIKSWLEKLHDVLIPDAVLVAAAKLTDQFDKGNFNPDKAIKAVQDAAERIRPENLRTTIELDVEETWKELVYAVNEARQALVDKGIASTIALPVEMYNRVVELVKKAEDFYRERAAVADGRGTLSVDTVKKVIAQKTGIASGQLNMAEEDSSRYVKMEEEIGGRVVNQERTIRAIANAIRRNKAGLSNPDRPMGKFLLVGPTGVGKTYLAKELARFLFNDPNAMTRFDMSEYMEKHAASRLIGAPPGYVGYEEGGQLTEAVRKKPYSVLLFDEIEKAHPDVFNTLLQVLDDGRLTDGQGRTVDFKNTVILMTSNAGMAAVDGPEFVRRIKAAKEALAASGASEDQIGAQVAKIEAEWDKDIDEQVASSITGSFRPEFLNRLDDGPSPDAEDGKPVDPSNKVKWIRVNRLREQDMRKIAELQMKEFKNLLADRHDTDLVVDPSVIDFLSIEGYSPLYGARPMTGAIEKNIIDPLANWILEEAASGNNTVRGGLIRVAVKDGRVVFSAETKPAKDIPRSKIEGAAETVAAELFSLIERLAGGDEGAEEPSEGLFDRLLRSARPASDGQASAEPAAAPARAFFIPDSALALPSGAAVAALSDKAATNAAYKAAAESVAAAGWPAEVSGVLQTPAGEVGEGWLKQLGAFAKDRARKAGAPAPELVSSADGESARVLVHFDAALSDEDRAFLQAHFTGTPPASFEAAQQFVDNMNVNGSVVRNHYLLDLYRRLRDLPSARMGYVSGASARGGRGTDVWLEIRKETPAPAAAVAAAAPAKTELDPFTPHEVRQAAETRKLMMRFIDQTHLKESDRDGTSIRIAAAESYARLATKEDLAEARAWFAARKWNEPNIPSVSITTQSGIAVTASLIFQRFGGAEEIALLENLSGNLTEYSDYQTPMHNAFVDALAAMYERGGLAELRRAQVRAAQMTGKNKRDIENALAQALGRLGYPADMDEIKKSPEGIVELHRRIGRLDELRADFEDSARWAKIDNTRKMAALMVVGEETKPTEETFKILGEMLSEKGNRSTERSVRYYAAQAWANFVARGRRTKGLAEAMNAYVDKHGVASGNNAWGTLYAYVLAAEQTGGPELLPALEKIMGKDPTTINYYHEQIYFSTPEAWAKALVRNGLFAEYARKSIGPDGAVAPSRLEKMLLAKDRPLLVSAALRAIALARDPSYRPAAASGPESDVPTLDQGSSSGGGYPYHGGMY
jgi:ATP-dependent Clp protease ATP-binding subunit ClpC